MNIEKKMEQRTKRIAHKYLSCIYHVYTKKMFSSLSLSSLELTDV